MIRLPKALFAPLLATLLVLPFAAKANGEFGERRPPDRDLNAFRLQCSYCGDAESAKIRDWVEDYLRFYREAGFSFEPRRLEIRVWEPGYSFEHLTSVDSDDPYSAVARVGRTKDQIEVKFDSRLDDSVFRGILFHEIGHWLQTEELRTRSSESLGLPEGYSEAMREEWMLQSEIESNWLRKGKLYAKRSFLMGELPEKLYRRLDGEFPPTGTPESLQKEMDAIVEVNRGLNARVIDLFPEALRLGPSTGKLGCLADYRAFTRGPSELMSDLLAVAYLRDLSIFSRVMQELGSKSGPERDFRRHAIQEPAAFLGRFFRVRDPILSSHRALTPLRGDIGERLNANGFDPKWTRKVFLAIQAELAAMRNSDFCGFDAEDYLRFWERLRVRLVP